MRKNVLKFGILSAVASLLLVGCGGGSSSSNDNGESVTPPPEPELSYKACLTKSDEPTYNCAPECTADEFQLQTYSTQEECEIGAGEFVASFTASDEPSTQEQKDGLNYINSIRTAVGLPKFKYSSALERATANHENYIGDVYDTHGVYVEHYEYSDTYPSDFYTGYLPTDRAKYEGYAGNYAGDVITAGTNLTSSQSLVNLMRSIYHRHAMFWSFVDEIGVGGVERNFIFKSQPHLMGSKSERIAFLGAITSKVIIYPYEYETEVIRTYSGGESPDPLIETGQATSGMPISFILNSYYYTNVSVTSFRLFDETAGNVEITHTYLLTGENDPNKRFKNYEFALFPLDYLEKSHTYRVEVNYVADGVESSKVWNFTTRAI